MLPIRDTVRSTSFPIVTWLIIAVNALVFFYEISLPSAQLNALIMSFGLVPGRLNLGDPLLLIQNPIPLITFLTHMFMHGGWLHFLSNMWILFIFGDNVEDRMGSLRFLVFYLLCGFVGALAQAFVAPKSPLPAIGASGAIAGVLGAYWALFPKAKVVNLVPLFFMPLFIEIPAIFYLGFWFVSQIYFGLISQPNSGLTGGVAWWAHIGGFVFGLVFHRFFLQRRDAKHYRQFPDEYSPF